MSTTLEIGVKEVTTEQVCSAPQPTRVEMAEFCNTLGLLIENRVPILKTLALTANSSDHPWFVAILSQIYNGIREGNCIVNSMSSGLKNLVASRVRELSNQDLNSHDWDPTQPSRWAVPDFFGYFKEFIAMVSAGEESGNLDTALFRVRDMNLNDGVIDSYESLWGHEVSMFCSVFEVLQTAGIPTLNCLKIISQHSPLKLEIETVIHEIENGSTLANALMQTKGQLSNPALVSIIDAGESSNELEMTLIRMRRN